MLEHLDIHSLAGDNEEFLRRLIEMMPLETLCRACQANLEINRHARFRVVDSLQVGIGDPADVGYWTYPKLMCRPQKLTPMNNLSVYMHPGIDPSALVAKMEKLIYRTLHIYGNYHWMQVLCFYHRDLTTVKLFGNMEMKTQLEGRAFFELIHYFKVKEFNLLTLGAPDWEYDALFTWNGSSGLFKKVYSRISEWYFRVTGVLHDGSKLRLKLKNYVDEPDDDVNIERLELSPEDSDDDPDQCQDYRLGTLKVKSANCRNNKYVGWINYSVLINRRHKTTPLNGFHVYMGTDINPTVLVDKMDQKCYRNLFIHGDYSWRHVVKFLHSGLDLVKLYGRMVIKTEEDERTFLTALARFGVKKGVIITVGAEERWFHDSAREVWSRCFLEFRSFLSGTEKYVRLTGTNADGSKHRLRLKNFNDEADQSSSFEFLTSDSNYSTEDSSVEAESEDADDQNVDVDAETDADWDGLLDDAAEPEDGTPENVNDFEMDLLSDDEASPKDSPEAESADGMTENPNDFEMDYFADNEGIDEEPENAAIEDEELKFSDNETLTLMMCLLMMILNETK